MAEHAAENRGVGGSIPSLATKPDLGKWAIDVSRGGPV
jgi:hypothetical protein